MNSLLRLVFLLLFMNFVGFCVIEGYLESSATIIWCNLVAVGAWIYTIIKGGNES